MPKVSIIIPMFNSAEFVMECLASVSSQTLEDIEVICVDDASSDATVQLFDMIAKDDDRFHLIKFDMNQGRSAARNAAIAQAQGEYLAFMDADDWYPEKTTLQKLVEVAEKYDAPIAGGSYSEYDNRNDKSIADFSEFPLLQAFTFEGEGRIDFADWQGDIGFQRFIYRRSLIVDNEIEFPPFSQHAVPLFLVRAMLAAGWFACIPDVVYRHRFNHKPNLIGDEWIEDAVESIAEILAISHEHNLDMLRERQVKALLIYAADSLGLLSGERAFLQARARAMKGVSASKLYRQLADIFGAYRSTFGEVLKHYSLD